MLLQPRQWRKKFRSAILAKTQSYRILQFPRLPLGEQNVSGNRTRDSTTIFASIHENTWKGEYLYTDLNGFVVYCCYRYLQCFRDRFPFGMCLLKNTSFFWTIFQSAGKTKWKVSTKSATRFQLGDFLQASDQLSKIFGSKNIGRDQMHQIKWLSVKWPFTLLKSPWMIFINCKCFTCRAFQCICDCSLHFCPITRQRRNIASKIFWARYH